MNPDEPTRRQSKYHDNDKGEKEQKFIFPDGREAVYDGDTDKLMDSGPLRGTFNYVNPSAPSLNPLTWPEAGIRGVGHFGADMLPFYIGGTDRKE